MSNKSKRPLVSFIVLAYNQEKYIEEAILGAFAQTYEPLEIILSDDNSSDNTFSIMEDMVKSYTGPHKIIINKNVGNIGIGGHVNKVNALANGELVILNAGDDISLPERTEKYVSTWIKEGLGTVSLHCNVEIINENSQKIGKRSPKILAENISKEDFFKSGVTIIGATQAYTKDIFDYFGDLSNDIVAEDIVITRRCFLKGKVLYVNESLVKYRTGGISSFSNLSNEEQKNSIIKNLDFTIKSLFQSIGDLNKVSDSENIKLIVLNEISQKNNVLMYLNSNIGFFHFFTYSFIFNYPVKLFISDFFIKNGIYNRVVFYWKKIKIMLKKSSYVCK